jgi:hypothetical protein
VPMSMVASTSTSIVATKSRAGGIGVPVMSVLSAVSAEVPVHHDVRRAEAGQRR